MIDDLSDKRLRLLLRHAADCQHSLTDIWGRFQSGGKIATNAIRELQRDLVDQVRGVITALARMAHRSPELCEIGANLSCTAVRISEVIFSRDERIYWLTSFCACEECFVDKDLRGKLLGNLGNSLADCGRLNEAESILQQRLRSALDDDDRTGVGLAKEHLGKLLLRQGRFREADQLLEEAYSLAVDRADEEAVTRLLKDAADAALRRGETDEGIGLLEERLKRAEKTNDPLLVLSTNQVLAERFIVIGRLEQARVRADRAAELATNLRLPLRRASIHGTLGNIAYDANQFDVARHHYLYARRIFRKFGRTVEKAMTATSLGLTDWKRGRLKQAARWFRESLQVDRATGRRNDLAIDLGNLAGVLAADGDYPGAVTCYAERIQVLIELKESSRAAQTWRSLATLHASAKNFESAVEAGTEAYGYYSVSDSERGKQLESLLGKWNEQRLANSDRRETVYNCNLISD